MARRKTIQRGRGKKVLYFTKQHEYDIIEYNTTEDLSVKKNLYTKSIDPVFKELISKIVLTYKFFNLDNVDELKDECRSYLMTVIHKYDPSKGSPAFSYFTVIVRNWFLQKSKTQQKKLKREIFVDSYNQFSNNQEMIVYNTYDKDREDEQFWKFLRVEMESWEEEGLRDNERKVLMAIFDIFENKEITEEFNKNAVYMYLRDLTNMNTKQVVANLARFRKKYAEFKERWIQDEY